jgi:hypothetical protein
MAMAMAMTGEQKKKIRELRSRRKSGCCCLGLGWAVYAPWACYMILLAGTLSALSSYSLININSKLAKCPLICLADLAGDLLRM